MRAGPSSLSQIKPGLSAYKATPSEAGASLRPLLAHAKAKARIAPIAPARVTLPKAGCIEADPG